jgi:hypothetical protein
MEDGTLARAEQRQCGRSSRSNGAVPTGAPAVLHRRRWLAAIGTDPQGDRKERRGNRRLPPGRAPRRTVQYSSAVDRPPRLTYLLTAPKNDGTRKTGGNAACRICPFSPLEGMTTVSRPLGVSGFETDTCDIEMRTSRRHSILQRCFVHPVNAPAPQPWQCIAYSISATGIAMALPIALPEGTVLSVQAWGLPDACPLRVQVVHTRQVHDFWFTGCESPRRLTEAELLVWRSGPIDWMTAAKT